MRQYPFRRISRLLLVAGIDLLGDAVTRGFRRLFGRRGGEDRAGLRCRRVERVLAVRLDHVGDFVLVMPALRALRETFPKARLSVLVGGWARELAEGQPYIDDVISFDAPWFARGKARWKGLWELWRLIWRLRRRGFDLGVEFRGDLRNNFLLWIGGVKVRLGYGVAGGGFFLTHEARYVPGRHEAEQNLSLIRALGWQKSDDGAWLWVADEERRFAEALWAEIGVAPGQAVLAIHPGAGVPWKRWPLDRFAEVARWAVDGFGAKVVVLGSAAEARLGRAVCEATGGCHAVDLTGRITLRQLAAILQRCRVFLGNDSAPAQLAGAVSVPAVVIFSGLNEVRRWRPLGRRVVALQHADGCDSCWRRGFCAGRCLDAVSAEEVKQAIERLWE